MFSKKTCKNCRKKVSKNNSFCPYCGTYLSPYRYNSKKQKNSKEDFGMLGENDNLSESSENPFANSIFSGFSGKIFNKMLNSTMKMLEKEMQKSMKEMEPSRKNPAHFELYINGKRIDPKNIKITQKTSPRFQQQNQKIKNTNLNLNKFFSSEKTKKFSELPLTEPKSNIRRLSDRIIYEISVPGVEKIENVSIINIGNSIEVKAISDKNSYMKIIPMKMDILKYDLDKETIVLELKG